MINTVGGVRDKEALDPHISVLRKLVRQWKVRDGCISPVKLGDLAVNVAKIHAKDKLQLEARSQNLLGDQTIIEAAGNAAFKFTSGFISTEGVRTLRWAARNLDRVFPRAPFRYMNPNNFRQAIFLLGVYVSYRVARVHKPAVYVRAGFAGALVVRFFRDKLLPGENQAITAAQQKNKIHTLGRWIAAGIDRILTPLRYLAPDAAYRYKYLAKQLLFLASFEIVHFAVPYLRVKIPWKYRYLRRSATLLPVPFYIFIRYLISLIQSLHHPEDDEFVPAIPQRHSNNYIMSFFDPTISPDGTYAMQSPEASPLPYDGAYGGTQAHEGGLRFAQIGRTENSRIRDRSPRASPLPSARPSPSPVSVLSTTKIVGGGNAVAKPSTPHISAAISGDKQDETPRLSAGGLRRRGGHATQKRGVANQNL
jgi:hypothetical protein